MIDISVRREQKRVAAHTFYLKNRDKCIEWQHSHRPEQREYENGRYHNDPLYREKKLETRKNRVAIERSFYTDITISEWKDILQSYDGRCVYCSSPATSQDHIIPLSKGGTHTADNVVPACRSCNSAKNNRPLLIFMHYMCGKMK